MTSPCSTLISETAQRALQWCDELGDRDGDGLQEYATRSRLGYYNQSWKDAADAILEPTGGLAKLPIATIELQGYLYAARLAMAELCEHVGDDAEAVRLRDSATALRGLVEERYWLEDEDFYAVALDGDKEPVRTISSNPGQLLWCGLPSPDHARRTTARLIADDMFSGWGLRTLSSKHPRYNPMSYQRGSVWPHDTMLAAAGMFRYGLNDEAAMLIRGLLDAACALEDARLPELFCGIERQAWGSGSVRRSEHSTGLGCGRCTTRRTAVSRHRSGRATPAATSTRGCLIGFLGSRSIGSASAGEMRIVLAHDGDGTVIEDIGADGIDVVVAGAEAALWGNVST